MEVMTLIDTIKVTGRFLEGTKDFVKSKMSTTYVVKDDVVIKEFTIDSLEGSWDNRISFVVNDGAWINDEYGNLVMDPYMPDTFFIEFSVHKYFLGHNCYDAHENLTHIVEAIKGIELDVGIPFIDYRFLEFRKIDIAFVYNVDDKTQTSLFKELSRKKYGRQGKGTRGYKYYEGESMAWYGNEKALKFYNKHKEYKKHDLKKLKKLNPEYANEVFENSKNVLRVELSLKKRQIEYLFGDLSVMNITSDRDNIIVLREKFDEEVAKVWQPSDHVIHELHEVKAALVSDKGRFMKGAFITWQLLKEYGEAVLLNRIKSGEEIAVSLSCYYKSIKILHEKNIVWSVTTIPEMYI